MMFLTYVDDDRNNNARRSLWLALSLASHQMVVAEQKLDSLSLLGRTCSAAAVGSAFSTGAERGDDAQLATEVLVW